MNKFKFRISRKSLLLALPLLSIGAAHAVGTPVDVTSVTDTITAQLTPISAVGSAVLSLVVGAKVFKWIRSAM